jgi:competence protein ComEC
LALGLVGTSVLAGAATAPIGLAHFGRLQWYGVAANAIAVPLTSVLVMPAGMAALLLMPLGLDAPALAAMGWGVEGVLATARMVASWPGAASGARPLPGWGLLLFLLGLCWLCLWGRRWRLLGLPMIAAGMVSGALHRPPDLLVSADARLIGVAAEGGLWLQRLPGASTFLRDQWLRAYGLAQAAPLPAGGEVAGGAIRCDATACVVRPHAGGAAALLLRQAPSERPCGRAALLVSAEPIRFRCRDSVVIDRFSVWRDGPHAAWLDAGVPRIVSDRAFRGARPWVPPPPRPRGREEAPPAPVE